ncbi:hypothetical protein K1719_020948 [Acacia pycnantha]|nr:hypothetical protein K1719_020948 [Acacia pycnantha]
MDLVYVLLSFLTLSLTTVSIIVSEDSTVQPCRFQCITSLLQSVQKLNPYYFSANGDKEMLLNLISPMDDYYKIVGSHYSDKTCYIVCDDLRVRPNEVGTTLWMLRNFGFDRLSKRLTVSVTQKEFSSSAALEFLRESKLGAHDFEAKIIRIGANEVYEILKAAMFTSSALTIGFAMASKQILKELKDLQKDPPTSAQRSIALLNASGLVRSF